MMSLFEQKKRDPFLTESVYFEQIEYWPRSNFFNKDVHAIIADINHDSTHRCRLSWSRCFNSLEHLVLRYSAGEDIDTLQEPAEVVFSEFTRHYNDFPEKKLLLWEPDAYQYVMWLLGLAVLFGKKEFVPKIATWISHKPEDGCDPLIAALFAHMGVNNIPTGEALIHPKPYSYLEAVVSSKSSKPEGRRQRAENMELYLKNWYRGMKGCYWYDRHKGRFATHFGYWSFESGLATLLFDIDDSRYRDMTFYPRDLVDYARMNDFVKNGKPA